MCFRSDCASPFKTKSFSENSFYNIGNDHTIYEVQLAFKFLISTESHQTLGISCAFRYLSLLNTNELVLKKPKVKFARIFHFGEEIQFSCTRQIITCHFDFTPLSIGRIQWKRNHVKCIGC